MLCPICKSDITEPLKQYGNSGMPICYTCFSDGLEWALEDPFILNELEHGLSLEEAVDLYHQTFVFEKDEGFEKFAWQICLAIEDY
jgi:hypothetical protein